MPRHVLTLDLRDDDQAVAAYRTHHAAIWPAVADSLKASGIRNLSIYLLRRRLVMIADVREGVALRQAFAAHHASPDPQVQEWERLMKSFQQPPPGAREGEWWALMEPVFDLSQTEPLAAATDRVPGP